jgi:elongation factor G
MVRQLPAGAAVPPLISISVEPKTDLDRRQLDQGLAALMREDPTIAVRRDDGSTAILGMSEPHLEMILDRLKREFDVEAGVGRPRIVFVDTITRSSYADVKYSDPHASRYAHVRIRLEPVARGAGFMFENECVGGEVPMKFIASVEAGIRSALERGLFEGHRVVDVRVVLEDGSYHITDSSDADFRIAAAQAFRTAAHRAGPVVLEPIMHVETRVPEEYATEISHNLTRRRGRVNPRADADEHYCVLALVPLSEMSGYAMDLRLRTHGRGSFAMRFVEYAPVPPGRSDEDRSSNVAAPRRPAPTPRNSSIALPEPDWDDRDDSQ